MSQQVITREQLEEQLKVLRINRDDAWNHYQGYVGAIQLCEYLLTQFAVSKTLEQYLAPASENGQAGAEKEQKSHG